MLQLKTSFNYATVWFLIHPAFQLTPYFSLSLTASFSPVGGCGATRTAPGAGMPVEGGGATPPCANMDGRGGGGTIHQFLGGGGAGYLVRSKEEIQSMNISLFPK